MQTLCYAHDEESRRVQGQCDDECVIDGVGLINMFTGRKHISGYLRQRTVHMPLYVDMHHLI